MCFITFFFDINQVEALKKTEINRICNPFVILLG